MKEVYILCTHRHDDTQFIFILVLFSNVQYITQVIYECIHMYGTVCGNECCYIHIESFMYSNIKTYLEIMCNKNSLFSKYLRSFSAHTHTHTHQPCHTQHEDIATHFWTFIALEQNGSPSYTIIRTEKCFGIRIVDFVQYLLSYMVLADVENWYFI